jgi:hypothetical protein
MVLEQYMYVLTKQEIASYIDRVLSQRSTMPDVTDIQRIKDATSLELIIQQDVTAFPSKSDATIELKYTCDRYIKQFLAEYN